MDITLVPASSLIGLVGIPVGNFAEKLAFAGVAANHWGQLQHADHATYAVCNFSPGKAIAYNAVISSDWEADADNRGTVPVGLSRNETFDMGGGNGLDYMIGPYYNVVRPDGAPRWEIRFQVNWLFP